MLETILSLLGGGLGGLLRFLPEVFKLVTLKKDQDHEFRMTNLQLQIDQARATQEIDKVHANESLAQIQGEISAYVEAVKGQGQLTGIKWLDGLNQSVRPFITYWWMILLTMHKIAVLVACNTFEELKVNLWTEQDAGIISMILGFWFVDRSIKYMKRA